MERHMKKTLALILASGATLAVAAPAFAQDNAAFTGPRIEGVVGYDISKVGDTEDDDFGDSDESIDGFMYGVGVGYDFAIGGAVIGVEAELSDSTAKEEGREDLGTRFDYGAGRDIYLGARAGILAGPNALLYVKGGYTNASYDILASDNETELEADLDLDGFRVGAGAEYAMSENTFVKLEYRYSNYSEGELDFDGDDIFDGGDDDSNRFDVDLDRHQVVLGFGFRF